ncbi:DUF4241 domain-containing protein [Streptacidiphilus monticola]|uniref:DUF4241 domain-containing protein n=1 Tax=Streptacidiphilus monticola TaxID=2161674 RepID=A0ABW1FUJ1_9ACTN
MPLVAPDVERLFTAGTWYDCGRGLSATVTNLPAAELSLPTGQVAACDPFVGLGDDVEPFVEVVDPGTYPVVLSVVEVAREEDPSFAHERVAAAWLKVSEEPTVRWSLALTEGQSAESLDDNEFYGYGVDAGTGCFVDAAGTIPLGDLLDEYGEPLADAMYGEESMNCLPASMTDDEGRYQFVAFPSGWGDGSYPTWVGHDESGAVTGFVTEFLIVPQPGRESAA